MSIRTNVVEGTYSIWKFGWPQSFIQKVEQVNQVWPCVHFNPLWFLTSTEAQKENQQERAELTCLIIYQ